MSNKKGLNDLDSTVKLKIEKLLDEKRIYIEKDSRKPVHLLTCLFTDVNFPMIIYTALFYPKYVSYKMKGFLPYFVACG